MNLTSSLYWNPLWKTAQKHKKLDNTEYVYLKLFLTHTKFEKVINTVKMLNFHTFSTVYRLHYFDTRFKNYDQKSARYRSKKFATGSSLTFSTKFNVLLKPVQNTLFFSAEILRIEIIFTSSGCPNQASSRIIGNNISLIWLSMPPYLNFSPHNRANFENFPCWLFYLFYVFLKLIKNRTEFGKHFFTKKYRLVNIFPMQYHLLRFDKRFESYVQKTVRRT